MEGCCAILLVIITGTYTYYAAGQLHKMKRAVAAAEGANAVAREALISVQRAFVTYEGFTPHRDVGRLESDPLKNSVHWVFVSKYENNGSTPAKWTIGHSEIGVISSEPEEERFQDIKGKALAFGTIGPKSVKDVQPISLLETELFYASLGDIKHLKSFKVKQNVFMWGWIAYRDIFSDTHVHVTEYCLHVNNARVNTVTENVEILADNCTHHNCIDEECEDYTEIAALEPRASK
ncbi:MAG: hypothetical protein WCC04_18840 [Terriglobales bacterium]